MQNDYSITIFSKNKGKTHTFSLGRRQVYILLVLLILLPVSCIFFGQAYLKERGERQQLEGRIALLQKLVRKSEDGFETQGGEAPTELKVEVESRQPVTNVVPRRDTDEKEVAAESDESGIQSSTEIISQAESVRPLAKIDEARVTFSEGDREGFRLEFKLVNLIGEPITGNIAIIASLSPPHNPRFVSFPSMKLVDGMPVKLKKSVGFDIRYYKYVTGKFYFPFSYAESFRILVYNRDEKLISDSTLPAGEVAVPPQPLSEAQTSPSDSI